MKITERDEIDPLINEVVDRGSEFAAKLKRQREVPASLRAVSQGVTINDSYQIAYRIGRDTPSFTVLVTVSGEVMVVGGKTTRSLRQFYVDYGYERLEFHRAKTSLSVIRANLKALIDKM